MRSGLSSDQPNLRPLHGLLLDLDGVVLVAGRLLPGSLEAIGRIRAAGLPMKFITNTTRRPRRRIVEGLTALGIGVSEEDVYTPATIAHDLFAREGLSPFLIVHPDLKEDFIGLPADGVEAVVVGDAGEFFTYPSLNQAFRKIHDGAPFYALAKNRNFLDHDGELSLDAGPFVVGLEYASGREAIVLGKPSPNFFRTAVQGLGCAPENAAMIGDDAEADVGGAMSAGLMGVLVRSGKYRAGHEDRLARPPDLIADDLRAAVDILLG
ncbi:TIGR01458 family HAD-type hydrolase [Methylocystis heyeri]|uniref:Phospholysine phosphohistidine inorganic pyrophosphate phosphatase n=1 Tax=Methylocystis heyeri TaxID=391905 RepID=A0A6B8KHP1_9HYPH|nr:TIGR01458 family HAD-type hydrolase [Methylocystis heyeri]QGM47152.1 TIGR01458 family HAD-type hydrolase [Methylocystis heyeri]